MLKYRLTALKIHRLNAHKFNHTHVFTLSGDRLRTRNTGKNMPQISTFVNFGEPRYVRLEN